MHQGIKGRKVERVEMHSAGNPENMNMNIINDILLHSLLLFLWGGGLVGLLVGIGMLLKPEQMSRVNQFFSRWVDTNKVEVVMDRPRWTERYFYRHHRVVGCLMLGGALVILYAFLFSRSFQNLNIIVSRDSSWLLDAGRAMLIVGSVLAAIVGLIMLLRPSSLRDVEKAANRWISTEGLLKFFNDVHNSFDQYLLRHRRFAGVFLVIASTYVMTVLGSILWSSGWKF